MEKFVNFYFYESYRRRLLNQLQYKYRDLYKGTVLDIGGRDRGNFIKPKHKVEHWIFADIEAKYSPDILLDVSDMHSINNESIDVICAIELFEHVENVLAGLNECFKKLTKNGTMLISVPFLYPVHSDPYDFQRWTDLKWKHELEKIGFSIIDFEVMGRFFTVFSEMIKHFIKTMPIILRVILSLIFPILDLIVKLDNKKFVLNNEVLKNYHGGYFFLLKKQINNGIHEIHFHEKNN